MAMKAGASGGRIYEQNPFGVKEEGIGPAHGIYIQQDATQSGSIQISLPAFPPGTRVTSASATVTGSAFTGLLQYLAGANVTRSPVVYDSDGAQTNSVSGQQAFIVAFTGTISLLGLQMKSRGTITLVLPWLGAAFASSSAYPAGQTSAVPGPGAASVGFAAIETTKLLIQVAPTGGSLNE